MARSRAARTPRPEVASAPEIPHDRDCAVLAIAGKSLRLSNLRKWIDTCAIEHVTLARGHPERLTAAYRIADRPAGRVLLDDNQNAWGRTLASVYSVRPRPGAPVSTPIAWSEVERGLRTEDFHLRNVPERVATRGDLWAPMAAARGRFALERVLREAGAPASP